MGIYLFEIFGSVARGEEHAGSDVDVLLIGDLSFGDADVLGKLSQY